MLNKALTVKGENGGGGLNVPVVAIDMFKWICISTFKFQWPARILHAKIMFGIFCTWRLVAFLSVILALNSNYTHLSATLSERTCSLQTSNKAFSSTGSWVGLFSVVGTLNSRGENPSRFMVKPAARNPNFTLLSSTFWNHPSELHVPERWQVCEHLVLYFNILLTFPVSVSDRGRETQWSCVCSRAEGLLPPSGLIPTNKLLTSTLVKRRHTHKGRGRVAGWGFISRLHRQSLATCPGRRFSFIPHTLALPCCFFFSPSGPQGGACASAGRSPPRTYIHSHHHHIHPEAHSTTLLYFKPKVIEKICKPLTSNL